MNDKTKKTEKRQATFVADIDETYAEKISDYCVKHNLKKKRLIEVMIENYFSEPTSALK